MSKQKNKLQQSVPAASFGWFYGKNGDIKTVVSKPFTIDELKDESKKQPKRFNDYSFPDRRNGAKPLVPFN